MAKMVTSAIWGWVIFCAITSRVLIDFNQIAKKMLCEFGFLFEYICFWLLEFLDGFEGNKRNELVSTNIHAKNISYESVFQKLFCMKY